VCVCVTHTGYRVVGSYLPDSVYHYYYYYSYLPTYYYYYTHVVYHMSSCRTHDRRWPYALRDTLLYADIVILLLLLSLYRASCTRIGRPLRLGPTRQVGLPSSSMCTYIFHYIVSAPFLFLVHYTRRPVLSSLGLSDTHHNRWWNLGRGVSSPSLTRSPPVF